MIVGFRDDETARSGLANAAANCRRIFRLSPHESCDFGTMRGRLKTSRVPPANRREALRATVRASIRSGSISNGGFASYGAKTMRTKSRSSTTIDLLPNPHPGEILLEEFLKPMSLSQTALANAIGVPPRRINEIVLGSAPSRPTRTCASRAIWECRMASSSVCRPTTSRSTPPPERRQAQGIKPTAA